MHEAQRELLRLVGARGVDLAQALAERLFDSLAGYCLGDRGILPELIHERLGLLGGPADGSSGTEVGVELVDGPSLQRFKRVQPSAHTLVGDDESLTKTSKAL